MIKTQTINIDGTKLKFPRKWRLFGKDHYPALCIIIEKRGSSQIIDFDWAGFFQDDVNSYYKLKKRGHTFKPPSLSEFRLTPDGHPVIVLWCPEREQYVPIDVKTSIELEQAMKINAEQRIWLVNEVRRILLRTQSFWEKHFALISIFLLVIIALVGIFIIYDSLSDVVNKFGNSIGGLSEAILKLANNTQSPSSPTPPF
jgi:hypothetical protein